jgi:uncharacterized membrane protein
MIRVAGAMRRYFLTGLLAIIPIWGTYLVLKTLLETLDGFVGNTLRQHLPYYIPGLGIIVLLLLIFTVGLLTANYLGQRLVAWGEEIMEHLPFVRSVYSTIKSMVGMVSTGGKENFRRVVLIEFPRKGQYSLAFVTGVTEGEIQRLTDEKMVNVYVPTTPNPTSGYLLFVPESEIIPVSMTVEDGMKMIISGGLFTPTPHETHKGIERASSEVSSETSPVFKSKKEVSP